MRTDVKGWGILLLLDPASLGGRCPLSEMFELFQGGLGFPVALGDLALIDPVKLQRLGKFEDVLLTPVSLERSRYGLLVRPDPGVAVLRQLVCIPLRAFSFSGDRCNTQQGQGFGEVSRVTAQGSGYVAVTRPSHQSGCQVA